MAKGVFSDINLAATAAIGGGAWSTTFGLENLKDDRAYVSQPARQFWPADLAKSQFTATLKSPRPITILSLFFHTLSLGALYRLTLRAPQGTFDDPVLQTPWARVFPRVAASMDLNWSEENWWLGETPKSELDLFKRHLTIAIPETLAAAVRLEFDDRHHPQGFFDIGGLWIAAGWSPAINFDRGRELELASRDQLDESPAGRIYAEERDPRRLLTVSWSMLTEPEAYRLFDASARARASRTVLFLPDLDSPAGLVREAFPATFERMPKPKFTYPGLNATAAVFKEILA